MEIRESLISESDYYKVGENIRELRRIYEETREQLAEAVGLTPAAISNYENWHRKPSRDDLLAIAKHYHITVSALLNGDFSDISIRSDLLIKSQDVREYVIKLCYPLIYSDEAMENKSFYKAVQLHDELAEKLFLGHNLNESKLEKCFELYEKAADDGIIDAAVGILWWTMLFAVEASSMSKKMMDFLHESSSETTLSELIREAFLSSVNDELDEELEKEKEEAIKELRKDILENIYYLKNSNHNQLYALADYYLALCYLHNIIGNGLTAEENRAMGREMLRLCCTFKNEFAIDYCTAFDFLDEEDNETE